MGIALIVPTDLLSMYTEQAHAADRARLFASFADGATAAGLVPCFFSVTEEAAASAVAGGWRTLRVAEEAVIDLPTLTFKGKAWQDVRTALNQAAKQGITWRVGPLAEQPRGIQLQVQAISAEWVEDKDLPEMGFRLGGVDEAMDPAVLVGLAMDAEGTVNGITSWMPIFAPGQEQPVGWTLDVMRRLPGGFRYSMEFSSPPPASHSETADVASSPCRVLRWPEPTPAPGPLNPTPSTDSCSSWRQPSNRTTGSSRCMPSRPSSSRDSPRCTCSFPTRRPCPASQWPSAGHTCPRPACATW